MRIWHRIVILSVFTNLWKVVWDFSRALVWLSQRRLKYMRVLWKHRRYNKKKYRNCIITQNLYGRYLVLLSSFLLSELKFWIFEIFDIFLYSFCMFWILFVLDCGCLPWVELLLVNTSKKYSFWLAELNMRVC